MDKKYSKEEVLALIKELVGEEEREGNFDCIYVNHPVCEVHLPPLPNQTIKFEDAINRNSVRQEILKQVEEELGG